MAEDEIDGRTKRVAAQAWERLNALVPPASLVESALAELDVGDLEYVHQAMDEERRRHLLKALRLPFARVVPPVRWRQGLERARGLSHSARLHLASLVAQPVIARLERQDRGLGSALPVAEGGRGAEPDVLPVPDLPPALARLALSVAYLQRHPHFGLPAVRALLRSPGLRLASWEFPLDEVEEIADDVERISQPRAQLPVVLDEAGAALASACQAALHILEGLGDGIPAAEADLRAIHRFGLLFDLLADGVVDLGQPRPSSLGEAASTIQRVTTAKSSGVDRLNRLCQLQGPDAPPAVAAAIVRVRQLAAEALARIDAGQDPSPAGLLALADLIVAVETGAGDEAVVSLDQEVRSSLPPELHVLVPLAQRGRLQLPAYPEANADLPVSSVEPGGRAGRTEAGGEDVGMLGLIPADASKEEVAAPALQAEEGGVAENAAGFGVTHPESPTSPGERREPREPDVESTRTAEIEVTGGESWADIEGERNVVVETATEIDIETGLASLVAQRRFGLASWLARSADQEARADALRFVAVADALRSPSGRCASRLRDLAAVFDPTALGNDFPTRLLTFAWAIRASLLTPYSGATEVVAALRGVLGSSSATQAIVDAVIEFGHRAVPLYGDLVVGVQSVSALESAVRAAVAEAARARNDASRRKFVYARAGLIWREWIDASGMLGRLLGVAAEDRRDGRSEVEARVRELRAPGALEERLDRTDQRNRTLAAPRIEARARRALLDRAQEMLGLVDRWLQAVERLERQQQAGEAAAWAQGPIARLRDVMAANREAMLDAVTSQTRDGGLAKAATSVVEAGLTEIFNLLLEGRPLTGEEVEPEVAENAELLLVRDLLLDGLRPPDRPPTLPAILEAVGRRDWRAAFDHRCSIADHIGTGIIVSLVANEDPDRAAVMRREREEALAAMGQQLANLHRQVRDELARAYRWGWVDDAEWSRLQAAVERAVPGDRQDLGVVRADLERIREAIFEARKQATAQERERLIRARQDPRVEAAAAHIGRLIENGDLATAQEVLGLVQAGLAVPASQPTHDFEDFYPRMPAAMAGRHLDEQTVRAAGSGGTLGPLDFQGLSEPRRRLVVAALRAWTSVSDHPPFDGTFRRLQPVLRLLGVEGRDAIRPERFRGFGNRRIWFDVVDARRRPESPVPAFGSLVDGVRGSSMRFLLCWGQPDVSSLVEWVQESVDRPVIVLSVGEVLAPEQRMALAEALRRKRDVPCCVVDDAVVGYLATHEETNYETTMRLVLPFTAVNPFLPDARGNLPIEMFFGRRDELREVREPHGTCFIYGGRQCGKTALLRRAREDFDDGRDRRAVYIDLAGEGIGRSWGADAIWDVLGRELAGVGIGRHDASSWRRDRVRNLVERWLEATSNRRLLVLLDECDGFFDADYGSRFENVQALKSLMEATDRRFKVVFAGLHQVGRYHDVPNQPLAHLGRKLSIGPLRPQAAFELVTRPLEALGYRFMSEDLVNRILAYCNDLPALLQLFASALTLRMLGRPRGAFPCPITEEDVEATYESPELAGDFRERVLLTLELDRRYKVIAHVLALESGSSVTESGISTSRLRDSCQTYWPSGFSGLSPEEFRALLEEMVGLGVLVATPDGYGLRSPNVRRMLGSAEQIEEALLEASTYELPTEFEPACFRRPLASGGGIVRSPLDERQLADLLRPRTQVRVLVGSPALGIDRVREALQEACERQGVHFQELRPEERQFESRLLSPTVTGHEVRLVDLRSTGVEVALRTLERVRSHKLVREGSTGTVLLMGPRQWRAWGLTPEGSKDSESFSLLGLRRWDARSLRAWIQDTSLPLQSDAQQRLLLKRTGGWPMLVDEVVAESMGVQKRLDGLPQWLDQPDQAARLLRQAGIGDDADLLAAWRALVELDEPAPAGELAQFLDTRDAEVLVESLRLLGALDAAEGGRLRCEPVLARATVVTSAADRSG